MKNKKTIIIVVSALFAALGAGLTLFPRIPIPGGAGGYVHLGDVMIYLAASMLPLPYSAAAAAIGGSLADIISGGAAWAPWTLFIKAIIATAFTSKNEKILCKRNYVAPVICIAVTVGGYFLAETVMYSVASALASTIWNVCQAVASMIIYYILGATFDKANLKQKLMGKLYEEDKNK